MNFWNGLNTRHITAVIIISNTTATTQNDRDACIWHSHTQTHLYVRMHRLVPHQLMFATQLVYSQTWSCDYCR